MDVNTIAHDDKVPTREKVDFLMKAYDRMADLSSNADTKAGVMLTFHSVWAICFGPQITKLIIQLPVPPLKMSLWVASFLLTCALFIAFVRSAYQAALILLPRIEPQEGEESRTLSLIFFVDVIKMKGETVAEKSHNYRAQLDQTRYEDLVDDLVYRINDIANVVNQKYECTKKAIKLSLYTFLLWVISLFSVIIMNMF